MRDQFKFYINIKIYIIECFVTSIIKDIPAMFGLENLLDEKDIYPKLHREMFGRHMSGIFLLLGFHLWPLIASLSSC